MDDIPSYIAALSRKPKALQVTADLEDGKEVTTLFYRHSLTCKQWDALFYLGAFLCDIEEDLRFIGRVSVESMKVSVTPEKNRFRIDVEVPIDSLLLR